LGWGRVGLVFIARMDGAGANAWLGLFRVGLELELLGIYLPWVEECLSKGEQESWL